MDKDLISYLEDEIENLEVDNWNEHTRDFSKGYKKGALFLLEKIKNYKMEECENE